MAPGPGRQARPRSAAALHALDHPGAPRQPAHRVARPRRARPEGTVVIRPGAGTFAPQPGGGRDAVPADYSWQTVALPERPVDASGLSPLADPPHADGVDLNGFRVTCTVPDVAAALRSALARAARSPDARDRPPAPGLHGLRAWFAREAGAWLRCPGRDCHQRRAGRAVGGVPRPASSRRPAPGRVADLSRSPAALRSAGIRPVPVPVDADGIIPSHLAEAFTRTGAQALFCQPAYHNPTGAVLAPAGAWPCSASRRQPARS